MERKPNQSSSSSSSRFEARFQRLANSTVTRNVKSTFSPKPEQFKTTHDYIEALIKHAEKSLELCLCSAGLSSLTVPGPVHKRLSSTLQVVDLSKNNLQEVPYVIRDCICLNRLYLPFNKLQHSPPSQFLYLASTLTVLDLSNNLLTGSLFNDNQPTYLLDKAHTKPTSSTIPLKFSQLRKLNVSNNKLTSLASHTTNLQLQFPNLLQLQASK